MKRFAVFSLPVILALLVAQAVPQAAERKFPTPPPSLDQDAQPNESPAILPHRVDLAQLQKQADDLARTAQTIPSDVASVRKGILPKDVIEKLKQIEKLSKRLRTELNQ
ncbi:MAG TPA: hypothetical protein VE377_16945 [Candidatus Dormibacteraeota bacterium]|nr:hypothetical protein [Candidatus Dormibacteraeota bacterium]